MKLSGSRVVVCGCSLGGPPELPDPHTITPPHHHTTTSPHACTGRGAAKLGIIGRPLILHVGLKLRRLNLFRDNFDTNVVTAVCTLDLGGLCEVILFKRCGIFVLLLLILYRLEFNPQL